MYSFVKPPMKDAKAQAAVAKARNENGVHLYFDEPYTKKMTRNHYFYTPLAHWGSTSSVDLTWTTVCCAAQDGAAFRVRISDQNGKLQFEYGVNETWQHYADIYEHSRWRETKRKFHERKLDKNDYAVLTAQMQYVKSTKSVTVEFGVGGDSHTEQLKYSANQDFNTFGCRFKTHDNYFVGTQIVETHFLYSGITYTLPKRGSLNEYISFKDANLCDMCAGDTAVIVGTYSAYNSKYRGILIGVGCQRGRALYDFASYKDSQHAATFRVQVGFFDDVSISSDKEEKTLPLLLGVDEVVWLLVENIDILNLEIHSTVKNR